MATRRDKPRFVSFDESNEHYKDANCNQKSKTTSSKIISFDKLNRNYQKTKTVESELKKSNKKSISFDVINLSNIKQNKLYNSIVVDTFSKAKKQSKQNESKVNSVNADKIITQSKRHNVKNSKLHNNKNTDTQYDKVSIKSINNTASPPLLQFVVNKNAKVKDVTR